MYLGLIKCSYFSYQYETTHNEYSKEMADEELIKAKSYKDTAEPICGYRYDRV